MTKEQYLERVRIIRALMEHPGWVLLERDWAEEAEQLKQLLVYQPGTTDEVRGVMRGKLDVLERLVNLAKILDAAEAGAMDAGNEE